MLVIAPGPDEGTNGFVGTADRRPPEMLHNKFKVCFGDAASRCVVAQPSAGPIALCRCSYVDLLRIELPRQSTKFRIVP